MDDGHSHPAEDFLDQFLLSRNAPAVVDDPRYSHVDAPMPQGLHALQNFHGLHHGGELAARDHVDLGGELEGGRKPAADGVAQDIVEDEGHPQLLDDAVLLYELQGYLHPFSRATPSRSGPAALGAVELPVVAPAFEDQGEHLLSRPVAAPCGVEAVQHRGLQLPAEIGYGIPLGVATHLVDPLPQQGESGAQVGGYGGLPDASGPVD